MKAAEQAALLDPAGQLLMSRFVPAAIRARISDWNVSGMQDLELTTTEPDVSVPHTRATLRVRVHVPLDHNRARSYMKAVAVSAGSSHMKTTISAFRLTRAARGKDDVRDFGDALIARVPNAHNGDRIVLVRERIPAAHDHAPRLADELRARGDGERVSDEVRAGVEEYDLAARELSGQSAAGQSKSK